MKAPAVTLPIVRLHALAITISSSAELFARDIVGLCAHNRSYKQSMEENMAKGQKKSTRETKKPKKAVPPKPPAGATAQNKLNPTGR